MVHFRLFQKFFAMTCMSAFAFCLFVQAGHCQNPEDAKITIGSKAPSLDVEHWLSDNDGKFEHVTEFEKDKVYVVEFWATWCIPCIREMPNISKLQKDLESKDVQIISISNEDIDVVEDFLDRGIRTSQDEEPTQTFGDLTNNYCITTDPDRSVMTDYLRGAGLTKIPSAFIVGKTGLVEWIGHPMRIKDPLTKIVEDKWDRDKFKKEYIEARKKEIAKDRKDEGMRRRLARKLPDVQQMVADGDIDEAIEGLNELIEDEEMESVKAPLTTMRLQIMIEHEHDEAAEKLREFVDENKKDGGVINTITWAIYERFEAKDGDVDTKVLKEAKRGAEFAAEAEPESGAILDTLAHYIYIVDEDLDKAIDVQKKAVKFAGAQLADIKPFLDELIAEKEGKKKKKKAVESDF